LRQVTLDPARQHAAEAIRAFRAAGVVVAVGHTAVGFDEAAEAFAGGASLLTHTFNGMPASTIERRDRSLPPSTPRASPSS
jgi:N-acetylglucosamine-6-phosphate deacetylase